MDSPNVIRSYGHTVGARSQTNFLPPQNSDRKFVVKVAALEIYNEVVKDLLSSEGTSLRLLDDKEVSCSHIRCHRNHCECLRGYDILRLFLLCDVRCQVDIGYNDVN